MSIPRWQKSRNNQERLSFKKWDKLIALIAITNLTWVVFDISYIPLRSLWVNKKISILKLRFMILNAILKMILLDKHLLKSKILNLLKKKNRNK